MVALYTIDRETLYAPMASCMARLIGEVLRAKGTSVHAVTSRAKTARSLAEKIRRKDKKYGALGQITDLVGVRIITYLAPDVDQVCAVLRELFIFDEENSADRRRTTSVKEFGYGSVHIVASLPEQRVALPEYRDFANIRFEIQVRTVLQHAWAEIEHDLIYKTKRPVTEEARRSLARVAALLEQADETFAATVHGIASDSRRYIADPNQQLNVESLTDMLNHDPQVVALEHLLDDISDAGIERDEPSAIERRVASLHRLKIDTPTKLRDAISIHFDRFRHFLPAVISDIDDGSRWSRGASLAFFCDYLAAVDLDIAVTRAYFIEEFDNEEEATTRSADLFAIIRQGRGLKHA